MDRSELRGVWEAKETHELLRVREVEGGLSVDAREVVEEILRERTQAGAPPSDEESSEKPMEGAARWLWLLAFVVLYFFGKIVAASLGAASGVVNLIALVALGFIYWNFFRKKGTAASSAPAAAVALDSGVAEQQRLYAQIGQDGFTELMYRASQGDRKAVNSLLESGSNPNAADSLGWTAISYASHYGHIATVKRLLEAGADPNTRNKRGSSPAELAERRGYTKVAKLLRVSKST